MVQSPSWEANWFAASQEILRISRNPKVHYRTHKRPPPISILGPTNPAYIPTSHLLEIYLNIIHPSMPRSPQWSLSLRFPHQDPMRPPLIHSIHCQYHIKPYLANLHYISTELHRVAHVSIISYRNSSSHFPYTIYHFTCTFYCSTLFCYRYHHITVSADDQRPTPVLNHHVAYLQPILGNLISIFKNFILYPN